MISPLLVLSVFGFLSNAVFASNDMNDGLMTPINTDLITADNRLKDRRDDRGGNGDGKQECRQEGVASVTANANANRKIVATTDPKAMKKTKVPKPTPRFP